MSSTSASNSATTAAVQLEEHPPPQCPSADAAGESNQPSGSGIPRTVQFSSGNPRIEVTRGTMLLFPSVSDSVSDANFPIGRNSVACVFDVPNHMTYADFCQFCGSFVQYILEMRILRIDGTDGRYSVLIKFDDQKSADNFHRHFDRRPFSSFEADVCTVVFVLDVEYRGSIENPQISAVTDSPNCPVCLERLDYDASGILTTMCNHSFHCSCISKWTDSSCPVCRYCQQLPENSRCTICETSENLWMCLMCGFVGCGRYKGGHAIKHSKDTQHCYSLELETQRVWDYVGDNYVHRLIQSKTDGKLVELNLHCRNVEDGCGNCECSGDTPTNQALIHSKVEAIFVEYNDLLKSQLDNQRQHFESLLLEEKMETEKLTSEAVQKALRENKQAQMMRTKIKKCKEEKEFLLTINENLRKNQEDWKNKSLQIGRWEEEQMQPRNETIRLMQEQLQKLFLHLEADSSGK